MPETKQTVTPEQANLYSRIMKNVYRKGDRLAESQLAQHCGFAFLSDEWREAVAWLVSIGILEILPAAHKGARRLRITEKGAAHAQVIALSAQDRWKQITSAE